MMRTIPTPKDLRTMGRPFLRAGAPVELTADDLATRSGAEIAVARRMLVRLMGAGLVESEWIKGTPSVKVYRLTETGIVAIRDGIMPEPVKPAPVDQKPAPPVDEFKLLRQAFARTPVSRSYSEALSDMLAIVMRPRATI